MHTTVLYQHSSARIRLETIYKSSSYNDKDKNGISRAGRYSECLFHPFSCILKYHKRERVTTALSIQLLEWLCPLVRSFVTKFDHIFNVRSSRGVPTSAAALRSRHCSLNLVSARTQSSWIHASHYGYKHHVYMHHGYMYHGHMHHGHICGGHTA